MVQSIRYFWTQEHIRLYVQNTFLKCKSLNPFTKFASKIKNIQVGNGECDSVLFIMLAVLDVHDHKFEIFT